MDDLVQWLRAQLDEDERIAMEAGGRRGQWRLATPLDDEELGDASWLRPPELKHAERHDPARVLREIDGKRRLLEALLSEGHASLRPGGSTAIYCGADYGTGESCDCGRDERVSRYLRLLALAYEDQPGYKPEWRP